MTSQINQPEFKAGMYLLETLTSGMYNEPLSIYREYIQNSVDSIDKSGISPEDSAINVTLDPYRKSVTITDNGHGIPSKNAGRILSSIGSSEKFGTAQRGFRGIGRLGGIAFSKFVTFRTRAKGESLVSIQKWDCKKLQDLLSLPEKPPMSLKELFSKVTSFSQETCCPSESANFFEVTLEHVESFRNYIFDISRIKKYLTQVAPIPFNYNCFSFGKLVNDELQKCVPQYGEYNILINTEQLYRQYTDTISITNSSKIDNIEDVEFISLKHDDSELAFCWYGKRKDFLGSVRKGEDISGLRVKVGNIQIGNQHLLDNCYRESRFNSYVIGEVHICSPKLIPNSRRDDFVDNFEKNILYNLIEEKIGVPLSKEIRMRSRICTEVTHRNANSNTANPKNTIQQTEKEDSEIKSSDTVSTTENIKTNPLSECIKCDKFENLRKHLHLLKN